MPSNRDSGILLGQGRTLLLAAGMLLLAGCASTPRWTDTDARDCLDWYHDSDRLIQAAGVRDAGVAAVDGYPFLRTDRWLASFAEDFRQGRLTEPAHWQWWYRAMADLDRKTRALEHLRLPADQRRRLDAAAGADCGTALAETIASDPHRRVRLLPGHTVADHYVSWWQIAGLYPIPALIAQGQIRQLHEKLAAPFNVLPEALPRTGRLHRYFPHPGDLQDDSSLMLNLTTPTSESSGIDPGTVRTLLREHAPILVVDTRNRSDRIGAIGFDEDGPRVETQQPLAYYRVSRTRYDDRIWLQLSYVYWFPERASDDIYGGKLDSLIWRVTLDEQLRPVVYDSIHGCGCYFMVFPAPGYEMRTPVVGVEPALSPRPAPERNRHQRMVLHVDSVTHYLRQLDVSPRPGDSLSRNSPIGAVSRYGLVPYDRLRAHRVDERAAISLFDRHGLVPVSKRRERFLLWPLGVRSPGAMRQWGTHAIAFVGRRHFDDARLFEDLIRESPN